MVDGVAPIGIFIKFNDNGTITVDIHGVAFDIGEQEFTIDGNYEFALDEVGGVIDHRFTD